MNRRDELLDTLRRSFDGGAWHGPALKEILADVSAEEACWKPSNQVHSIWEITLHAAGWANEVASRLGGRKAQEPDGGDWPRVDCRDNDAWEDALQQVVAARDALLSAVGAAQHNTYHAGQIAILKKQARAI